MNWQRAKKQNRFDKLFVGRFFHFKLPVSPPRVAKQAKKGGGAVFI